MEYYNSNIQLKINVIEDVFTYFNPNSKMLVFGLGYDSKMWYKGNNKNTFFIENNDEYIKLNNKDIPSDNIVKYEYTTTCLNSINLCDDEINKFKIPEKIVKESPFDIIIIDGPEGYAPTKPGRLIPSYWSTMLSKKGTVIYFDDTNRPLEKFCIEKYFKYYPKKEFNNKTTKIYI